MQTLKRTHALVLIALCAFMSTAATCQRAKTPEGTIALYGAKIGKTVGLAQEAIGAIGKTTQSEAVLNAASGALDAMGDVNQLGLELADRLDAIVTIRESTGTVDTASVDSALKLVDAIDAAIDLKVIPKLGDHPETAAALQAAREIGKLVLTIQFELGRLQ
jgi:hypothetical protein